MIKPRITKSTKQSEGLSSAILNETSVPAHTSNDNQSLNSTSAQKNSQSNNQPSLHIDLQIHISPEADTGQIETIFASIAKHLYKQ